MPSILRRAAYEIVQSIRGLPSSVFIDITERCELKCRMCRFWSDGDHDASREFGTRELAEMLDQIRRDLGVRRLRFVGGEPFLHPGLLDVVAHVRSRGMHVNIVTNGTHVDADMARCIVASGLDSIRFSVDGVGEVHDRVRGRRGTFALAEGAIDHLIQAKRAARSARPEIQVFTLITALNPDALDPVREWVCGRGERIRHFYGPVAETTPEQVQGSTWEGLALANGQHLPFGRSLVLEDAADRQLRATSAASRVARFAGLLGMRPHCPEAHNLHVDPFGRVKFCALYTNYAFGVFPRNSMREIWFSRRHLRFLRHVHRDPLPMCRDLCGVTDRNFEGNMAQLARHLLLGLVPSPLRGRKGSERRFVHEPKGELLAPRRPVAE